MSVDVIDRLNEALHGRYRIEREIGEGGMATVYLADDLRHERKVAVKVLKADLAAVVGAERFLSEIKTTANLQHPHILPLFDSGEADGFLYFVMPYIEGETLRERLDREKQLPVEEAVAIATAVANALQAAHDQGVVHRDIKPANILMSQGEPLVADFGIALAVGAAGGPRLTETGLSVGTPYYMSPEQATGDTVGPPSDVYALACVLYEMLVGEPPYTGSTAQAVLGKIIMGEPVSATAVRASIPPSMDAAIRKSLEKLPADRFTSAQAFARALADPTFRYGAEGAAAAGDTGGGVPRAWRAAALAFAATTVLGLAAAVWAWPRPETPDPVVRAHLDLGELTLTPFERITVSGDGSRFATTGEVGGERALYVRNADEERFRRIPGTEGAYNPKFSPAGDWIVYLEWPSGALLRVSLSGGTPRVIVPGDGPVFGLHWARDGTLLFQGERGAVQGIFRVPETGGDPELVLEGNFTSPRLLPGGRALVATDMERRAIVFFDFETDSARALIPGGVDASYIETGHLLYVDPAGGLWAVGFDPGEGALDGEPTPVLDRVAVASGWRGHYAISNNGTLVYRTGGIIGVGGDRQLLVTDLDGNEDVRPLEPRPLNGLRWSPDGSSVAFWSRSTFVSHIHTYDVELGTAPRQLTLEGSNTIPVWSPDGTRVAFASDREGTDGWDLFVKRVDGDAPPELILSRPGYQAAFDWPAEDALLFADGSPSDLWIVDPADSTTARPYLTSEGWLSDLSVSPDGSLAAYTSNETGVDEVYVRSFPTPRQPVRVSDGGGRDPRWSPGGDVLYYWKRAPEDTLFAVRVQRQPTFALLSREALFARRYETYAWDLHPDGDRFAVPRDIGGDAVADEGGEAEPDRVLVVTNWFAELRAALGEN